MRLLGFIKFFNYEKGYGFIFTNRFGIEQNQNGLEEKNNGSIELYFKYKDVEYTWTELPRSRDFVSFEYDLPHKDSIIGRVRHIKKISYLEEEYSLALSYLYNYTTIECGNNSIRLVPYFFGHAFLRNKQSVFDFLLDNAKISIPDISNIVLELSIYRGLSNLFFQPEKNGLIVKNIAIYKAIFPEMALKLLNTVLSGSSDGEEDLLFVECIKRLDNEKIKLIGEHLFKLQNEGDKRVDSLISKAKQVFARVHYTGGKSVFVIYNEQQVVPFFSESIIELWNHEIIDMPECFFDAFINKAFAINRKLLQHAICEKIASSFISNDYLLLFCALVANSRTYFERIKDYSILSTWLVKQTAFFRYHLPSFLKLSKYCPIYELKKAISIITAPQLLDYLSGNEAPLQCLPQELLVKIEVVINVSSEKQVVESTDWHGGYFTWGEGKKGEHYEINTYLRKEFDASYYTVTPQSVIISYIQDELKGKFSSYTKKFVESKNMSNCFMGITVDQEDYFVQLSLCSHESLDSTFLFSLRNFADVLLSTETIYE